MAKIRFRELMKGRYSWILIAGLIILLVLVIPGTIVISNISKFADTLHREYNTVAGEDVKLGGVYRYNNMTMNLPEGFFVSGVPGYEVARNKISADIVIYRTREASSEEDMTEEALRTAHLTSYGERTGEVLKYRAYEIDGHPAFIYKTTYRSEEEYAVETEVYVLFEDKTVLITFCEYSDRYSDAFERTIDTIHIDPDKGEKTT